jgi:hypothetical protein
MDRCGPRMRGVCITFSSHRQPCYHACMKCCILHSVFCILFFVFPSITSAHPLDVSYLDVGYATSTGLTLTAALHPHEAYTLLPNASPFNLQQLQKHGDLISAYAQDHVQVTRSGYVCTWHAENATTPNTELDAIADGVTVFGTLDCPGTGTVLRLSSTLFLDIFPHQTTMVRLDLPNGYAERGVFNRHTTAIDVSISELLNTDQQTPHPNGPVRGNSYVRGVFLSLLHLDPIKHATTLFLWSAVTHIIELVT